MSETTNPPALEQPADATPAPVGVPWLGGRLQTLARECYGAPEHRQIGMMAAKADSYILTADLVRDIVHTIDVHTSSIEQNIDLIQIGATPIWIEFPDAPRRAENRPTVDGAADPVLVGALIAPDEGNSDRFVVVTAWDFPDGTVRHSYGVAAFSLIDMAQLAYHARHSLSRIKQDCLARLLHQASISIPPGLFDEMRIVKEIDDEEETALEDSTDAAALDVAADIPFILTALLAISTGQTQLTRRGDEGPWLCGPNACRVGWLEGLIKGRGFVRKGKPTSPSAVWRLAA